MFDYKFYTLEEFKELNEDIKWDIYSELVNEFKRKLEQNDRQFNSLRNKQDIIINLKEILHAIIDRIGEEI